MDQVPLLSNTLACMRAIMAATFLTSPLKCLFLLVLLQYFLHNGHCLVSCASAVAVTDRHAVIWSLNRWIFQAL